LTRICSEYNYCSKEKYIAFYFVLSSLNRNFAGEMTSIHKTNILLALVAIALAVLCVLSIMT